VKFADLRTRAELDDVGRTLSLTAATDEGRFEVIVCIAVGPGTQGLELVGIAGGFAGLRAAIDAAASATRTSIAGAAILRVVPSGTGAVTAHHRARGVLQLKLSGAGSVDVEWAGSGSALKGIIGVVHDVSAAHRVHSNWDVEAIHVANIIPVHTTSNIVEGPLSEGGRGLSGATRALKSGTTVTSVAMDATCSVAAAASTSPETSRLGATGDLEGANATRT